MFFSVPLCLPSVPLINYVHLLFDQLVVVRWKDVSKALHRHHGHCLSVDHELASLDDVVTWSVLRQISHVSYPSW